MTDTAMQGTSQLSATRPLVGPRMSSVASTPQTRETGCAGAVMANNSNAPSPQMIVVRIGNSQRGPPSNEYSTSGNKIAAVLRRNARLLRGFGVSGMRDDDRERATASGRVRTQLEPSAVRRHVARLTYAASAHQALTSVQVVTGSERPCATLHAWLASRD